MFFKRKSNVIFRNYESFGYITDNRNFGYKLIGDQNRIIGDKILSESGAVFFSVLEKNPQSFDTVVKKIKSKFEDVDIETIIIDVKEFYDILERDGFIVSGETQQKCEEKDKRFSYKLANTKLTKKEFSPRIMELEKSTQDFLEEYFDGKPQLTNLHIEITSKCNERCVHCYIPNDNKTIDIEPDLFYNVLEQCKEMKLLHITISGGEPLLHKHFCDFLRKCREYEFSVNILSNLTLIDDEIINEMKRNPLLGVQVSLYSMDSNIHDKITQTKGSFEKTKNAIIKLIENNILLQISCPIMKQNKNCYNDVKNWATKRNIQVGSDYVMIGKYDHTTENLTNRLSISEIKEVIKSLASNDTNYMEDIEKEAMQKNNISATDIVCSVCHSSICISENGSVYPCVGWQNNVVGNIKIRNLKEIWDNSEKVQYLRGLRRKDFPKCIDCSDKKFCTMCMVRNANEDILGNPLSVNEYFCEIAKLNRKMLTEWKNSKKSES